MTLPASGGATRRATTLLLAAIYAANSLDRYILGILLPSIKPDLGLSDTQLGLLSGLAFATFYAVMGMPLARLGDLYSRKSVIVLCLSLFSVTTALCGLAQGFWSLVLLRALVAIGEAGTNPGSFSMIADLYPRQARAGAMATLTAGANIGMVAAFTFGGMLAVAWGWRSTFLVVGIPGLLLAAFAQVALREPQRRGDDAVLLEPASAPRFSQTLAFMWGQRSFRHLVMGGSLMLFAFNGVITWLPSFLDRTHALSPKDSGPVIGLGLGVGGLLGTLLIGGWLVDRLAKRDVRWQAWSIAMIAPILAGGYAATLAAPEGGLALLSFMVPASLGAVFQAPTLAMVQSLAPARMRATASALLLLIGNLVGLGLGPFVIGRLSDWLLSAGFGADSLRVAMSVAVAAALWATYHYVRAAKFLVLDFRRVTSLANECSA